MIIPDKKKMATMIVTTHLGGHDDAPEPDYGSDGDYKMLAGEVMKAFESKDVDALADALLAFHKACESDEDYEGEAE